jgi:type II secretory pathway predicted ATPase ExeA/outer membrane protein OmpA-like peptidoglycan-associated protein
MYTSFYKLERKPFALNPDPQFLWIGENQQEVLATLRDGVLKNEGFLLLISEAGTGKTTIVNELMRTFGENTICAVISDHSLGRLEFYNAIANDFKFGKQFSSKVQFLIQFSHFLYQAEDEGKRVVLVVDDCHKLSQEMFEELRLFSNIEKADAKLIDILFVGRPEFNEMLLEPQNRAIRQQLARKATLVSLGERETAEYIRHRLRVAGSQEDIFTPAAFTLIHQFSGGIPRKINILCKNALNVGAAQEAAQIDEKIIEMCVVRRKRPDTNGGRKNTGIGYEKDAADSVEEAAVPAIGATAPSVAGYNLEHQHRRGWWTSGVLALFAVMIAGVLFIKFRKPELPEIISSPVVEIAGKKGGGTEPVPAVPVASTQPLELSTKREAPAGRKIDTADHAEENAAATDGSGNGDMASRKEKRSEKVVVPVKQPEVEQAATATSADEGRAAVTNSSSGKAEVHATPLAEEQPEPAVKDDGSAVVGGARQSTEKRMVQENAAPVAVVSAPASAAKQTGELLPPFESAKVVLPLQANSTKLTNEAELLFDDFVKRLRKYPRATLMVRGYVSANTNSPENIKLSAERARGVYDLLVDNGIDEERIELKGMGNQDPIASNTTSAGRQKNRRVEIQIVDDGTAH